MPEISRFFGIVIAMFYKDHTPPHFHAYYGDWMIIVNIQNSKVKGKFPKRAKLLVLEWLGLHREELLSNWELAIEQKPLLKIQPLE